MAGEGNAHRKGSAAPLSRALGRNLAAVQLHQFTGDGQAQSEAGVLTGTDHFSLPESLEDMRQKVRADAHTGVDDREFNQFDATYELDLDLATGRGEFERVAEQIAEDLLDTLGVDAHDPDLFVQAQLDRDSSIRRDLPNGLYGASHRFDQSCIANVQS